MNSLIVQSSDINQYSIHYNQTLNDASGKKWDRYDIQKLYSSFPSTSDFYSLNFTCEWYFLTAIMPDVFMD